MPCIKYWSIYDKSLVFLINYKLIRVAYVRYWKNEICFSTITFSSSSIDILLLLLLFQLIVYPFKAKFNDCIVQFHLQSDSFNSSEFVAFIHPRF